MDHFGYIGIGLMNEFGEFLLGLFAPMPGVFKRRNLCVTGLAFGRFEEQVVVPLAVEGRVEVDQVNGFVWEVVTEDVEVVAEVEGGHGGGIEN